VIAASPDLLEELPLAAACAALGLGRGSYYRAQSGKASKGPPVQTERSEAERLLDALERVSCQ